MMTAWRVFRVFLDMMGGAAIIGVIWIHAYCWWERHTGTRVIESESVTPTARKIAEAITPGLLAVAREYEPMFLKHAAEKGAIAHFAAGRLYPVVEREIPHGAEVGVNDLLTYFGHYKVGDLADLMVSHAKESGESIHPSFYNVAQRDALWRFP